MWTVNVAVQAEIEAERSIDFYLLELTNQRTQTQ